MKKHRLTAAIVLIGAGALAAAALCGRFRDTVEASAEYASSPLRASFAEDDVARIKIKWGDVKTTLELVNGAWTIGEKHSYSADEAKVASLLDAVIRMRPLKTLFPVDGKLIKHLRLSDDPKRSEDGTPGVRYTFIGKKGEILYDVVMGRGHFIADPDSMPPNGQEVPDGRYAARVEAGGKELPFLTSSLFEEFYPVPGAWLSGPYIENPENSLCVMMNAGKGKSWALYRKSLDKMFYCTTAPSARVSVEKLRMIFGTMAKTFVTDAFRRDEFKYELTLAGVFSLTDSTGLLTHTVIYSAKEMPDTLFCRVKAQADPGAPGRDALEKRAKDFNLKYEDWIFVFPKPLYELIEKAPVEERPAQKESSSNS